MSSPFQCWLLKLGLGSTPYGGMKDIKTLSPGGNAFCCAADTEIDDEKSSLESTLGRKEGGSAKRKAGVEGW